MGQGDKIQTRLTSLVEEVAVNEGRHDDLLLGWQEDVLVGLRDLECILVVHVGG